MFIFFTIIFFKTIKINYTSISINFFFLELSELSIVIV